MKATNLLVAESVAMRGIRRKAIEAAQSRFEPDILLIGETGVGKEIVAKIIYENSQRNQKAFVIVNCAAITKSLIESSLFGHVKGSFTGAHRTEKGFAEQANGGILFLDDLLNLNLTQQGIFLQLLQNRKFHRVGEVIEREVDVRVIVAINMEPARACEEKKLLVDLSHRLQQFIIRIPPLRERVDDIPVLAERFVQKLNSDLKISKEALEKLTQHFWPGNVRELENTILRTMVVFEPSGRKVIEAEDLLIENVGINKKSDEGEVITWEEYERNFYVKMAVYLEKHKNFSKACRLFGIDRGTAYRKLESMGFKKHEKWEQ